MKDDTAIAIVKNEIEQKILHYRSKFAKEADDEIGIMYESKIEILEDLLEFINNL